MDLLWACEIEHLRAYCDRVLAADAVDPEKIAALFGQIGREEKRQILAVNGDTAIVDIRGTLTNRAPLLGRLLGFNTTAYTDIQEAIETIGADDTVKNVRLVIDSPGGNVTGLDETWMAIRELAKTLSVVAENHGLMASAAYWLATAADQIVATSPAAETGSIGVYMLAVDYSKADERLGIKEIRIVSKNAPNKNPDPATAAGLKTYQARLDALERVFISRVAEGRGVPISTVEKDYGRGAVLVAIDPDPSAPSALKAGMIDGVTGAPPVGAGRWRREGDGAEGQKTDIPTADISAVNAHIDKNTQKTEKGDQRNKQGAAGAITIGAQNVKFADLKAADPDLFAEVEGLIASAKTQGKNEGIAEGKKFSVDLLQKVRPALSSGEPFIAELAAKVLTGEASEAELTAARVAYDKATEAAKAGAAVAETTDQGATATDTPPVPVTENGEIRTEDDHGAEVARFRRSRGQEV